MAVLTKIRPGRKDLPETNTLTYHKLLNYGLKKFYNIWKGQEVAAMIVSQLALTNVTKTSHHNLQDLCHEGHGYG